MTLARNTGGDTERDAHRLRMARPAVAVVFAVHGLLFASWAAHIPLVKTHLGVDDAAFGLGLLGAPVGSIAAIVVAAYLVPRLGSRTVVRIALVGYCLGGALVGLAGEIWQLFLALFVWGAFQGGLDISMNTQAISVEKAYGRPLLNGMHAYWGIGAFIGAGVGMAAVAVGLSLTLQLLVLGATLMVAAGSTTLRMLPDPDLEHLPEPAESGSTRRWRISTGMVVLGGIAFASMLCEGASADWSSIYLRDSLDASALVGGLAYTAFTLAMVAIRLAGDRLIDRGAATTVLPLLAGAATIAFMVALAVGNAAVSVAGFFVLGLGLGVVIPTVFSAAGRLPGVHPGVGVAAVSGLGWAGFVCGPPIIGQLAGLSTLSDALILVPVLTAFIAVATRREKRLLRP